MMDTLWFGGSFNPIHVGHLLCARAVAESAGFGRVVLVPNAQSPHKQSFTDLAPAIDRLAMCRLATAGDALFDVDGRELERSGPSYTIDTVGELRREGVPRPAWLIGADQLLALPSWHRAAALLTDARLVVMARLGWPIAWDQVPPPFAALQQSVVAIPQLEISATDIRRRVAAGRSIRHLVPDAVADYIAIRRLYTALSGPTP